MSNKTNKLLGARRGSHNFRLSDQEIKSILKTTEGCNITDLIDSVMNSGFDPDQYLANHIDLQKAGLNASNALGHFLTHGLREGERIIPAAVLSSGLREILSLPITSREYRNNLFRSIFVGQLDNPETTSYLWSGAHHELVARLRDLGAKPYFVIGDSHSILYRRVMIHPDYWLAPLSLLCRAGSAIGLANENSRSGFGMRILSWAAAIAASKPSLDIPIFVKFGQVDAEFVWNFHRIRDGVTRFSIEQFREFAARSVNNYAIFLEKLARIVGPSLLRICSIFPPVLANETWAKGYVDDRVGFLDTDKDLTTLEASTLQLEIPDLAMRTRLHAIYNDRLREICDLMGLAFVDDFHPMLGDGGTTDERYFPVGQGKDHHLEYVPTEVVIVDLIERFFHPCFMPRTLGA